MSATLKVFIVVGEESGDSLAAALMQALRAQVDGQVEFAGIGGDSMARQGLNSLFPLHETALMGFSSLPRKLLGLLRRIRQAADAAIAAKPDVLLIVDSPEFTHRVAKRVRLRDPSIPVVDYVSPSVWAWRPGRARVMRGYVDHVLALLPFEPEAHRRLGGPPCTYVGHPLTERVSALRPNVEEVRRRDRKPPVLLVMPGSRRGELGYMLPTFAQTAALVAEQFGTIEIVVPSVAKLAPMLEQVVAAWPVKARVVSDPAEKDRAFRIARAALVKSGTGTLELALAGVPMIAAYRASALENLIIRPMIQSHSVILANLVLGENIVPEFLQDDGPPEVLARHVLALLGNTPERQRQLEAFAKLDTIMEIGTRRPSDRAAQIVLDIARSSSRH